MIRVLVLLLLILSVIFTAIPVAAGYTDVTVTDAKSMIDSDPELVILDVRHQIEYDTGHIAKAKLIPLQELAARLDELDVNDRILVYCLGGSRSRTASETLEGNGFLHIFNMLGGITAWKDAGYPVYIKYSSLQETIDNADEGETILVSTGTYHENIVVNKTLALIGEDRRTTIIDGSGSEDVIQIRASSVTVKGFMIQNGWNGIHLDFVDVAPHNTTIVDNIIAANGVGTPEGWGGILVEFSDHNNISFNIVSNNSYGIALWGASGSIISHNILENNAMDGVFIDGYDGYSGWNTLSNNTIAGNGCDGIYLSETHNNTLITNIVSLNNQIGLRLFGGSYSSDFNRIINNTVTSHWCGILLSTNADSNIISKNEIIDNEVSLELSNSSHNVIHGNNIRDNNTTKITEDGIRLSHSSNNTVSGNEITGNYNAIHIRQYSDLNTVSGNSITNNMYGVILKDYCSNNTVTGRNTITNNVQGIHFSLSPYNNIFGNDITSNDEGIALIRSSNNTVCENNITGNQAGISVNRSTNNTVCYNNIATNNYGINFSLSSDSNRFYHNSFINNTHQIWPDATGTVNDWDDDYPSGGNYWSDYNGTDLYSGPYQDLPGGDGIGDTPYVIDEDNHDNYPLLAPISLMPWDITGPDTYIPDGKCDMRDIGLVARHFGQTVPPAPVTCDLTGSTYLEPDGKVDMRDVGLVARHFGETAS